MKFKKSKSLEKNFISKAMIGLGYGLVRTRDLILNEPLGIAPQDAMDSLSLWIGRELMKEMLDQKIIKVTDNEQTLINALMNIVNLAEELDVDVVDHKVKLIVQKCLICPRRVGGYDLEGMTACPVGGILTGAISYARGSEPLVTKNHLQAGEICHIEMDF